MKITKKQILEISEEVSVYTRKRMEDYNPNSPLSWQEHYNEMKKRDTNLRDFLQFVADRNILTTVTIK